MSINIKNIIKIYDLIEEKKNRNKTHPLYEKDTREKYANKNAKKRQMKIVYN